MTSDEIIQEIRSISAAEHPDDFGKQLDLRISILNLVSRVLEDAKITLADAI